MELWIRSQKGNKNIIQSLSKVSNVWICNAKPTTIEDHDGPLGEYKSSERALEVLNEIQSILMPKCIINSKSIKLSKPYEENGMVLMDCNADARLEQLSTYVYEMPQE